MTATTDSDGRCRCGHDRGDHLRGYAYGRWGHTTCRQCRCLRYPDGFVMAASSAQAKDQADQAQVPPPGPPDGAVLTPKEVADMFRVGPQTVARWEHEGRLVAVRTPGGHRRYRADQVQHLLSQGARDVPA